MAYKMKELKMRKESFGRIYYDPKIDKFWRTLGHKRITSNIYSTNRDIPFGDDIPNELAKKLSAPLSVGWVITNQCNALCDHCHASSSPSGLQGLKTKELKKIINILSKLKVFRIDFSGGEPTLRKDLTLLIKECYSKGISPILSTNGYFPKRINKILPYLTALQVSIDFLDKEQHNKFRNLNYSWERAIETIKYFSDKVPIRVFTTLSKMNMNTIQDLTKLLFDLGVQEHQYLRYIPSGRGKKFAAKYDLSDSHYNKAKKKIAKLGEKYKGKMVIECIDLSKNDSSYILIREDGEVVTLSTNFFEYIHLGNLLKNDKFWDNPRINKPGHLHLWTDESYF